MFLEANLCTWKGLSRLVQVGRFKGRKEVPAPIIKSKKPSIVKSQLQLLANFGTFRAFAHWTIPHFRCFSVQAALVTNRG